MLCKRPFFFLLRADKTNIAVFFVSARIGGSGSNLGMLLGGSTNEVQPEEVDVTFADVRGVRIWVMSIFYSYFSNRFFYRAVCV